jgi:S1-C subfamily serine protease
VETGGPADKAVLDSGQRTQLGIWRQGKAMELSVQLGDANDKTATLSQVERCSAEIT